MKNMPCKECLKFAVCKNKKRIICKDLLRWVPKKDVGTEKFAIVINNLSDFWGKNVTFISFKEDYIYFAEKDYPFSAMVELRRG